MYDRLLNNRYRIQGDLGAGSMGRVYYAIDTLTDRDVAIKVLPPSLSEDQKYLARFEREASALRDLEHPNIVPFIDSFTEEGNHYIVMAYMPGGSLYDVLKTEGALPVEDAVQITIGLTDALTRSHGLGIIHRDIKPENILIGVSFRCGRQLTT